jgi:hypothetical protein
MCCAFLEYVIKEIAKEHILVFLLCHCMGASNGGGYQWGRWTWWQYLVFCKRDIRDTKNELQVDAAL